MKFEQLLEIIGNEPLFETGLLLAGDVNPNNVRRQLSYWTKTSKLYQLRRGLYMLAPPYQKNKPHPFVVANKLVRSSYVSLHAALAYYNMIPEYVAQITSVTGGRPGTWETPIGTYTYRHVKPVLLDGYELLDLGSEQQAFVATPEKALLDLVYLEPDSDTQPYLYGLRLQSLDKLNLDRLHILAQEFSTPKLQRAASVITTMAKEEIETYEIL